MNKSLRAKVECPLFPLQPKHVTVLSSLCMPNLLKSSCDVATVAQQTKNSREEDKAETVGGVVSNKVHVALLGYTLPQLDAPV